MRLWSLKISEILQNQGEIPARRSSPAQRQGAADLWATASSADLRFCFYVLSCLCVWVYAIVRLWGSEFVGCYRFVSVCVYVFVFVCVLCAST